MKRFCKLGILLAGLGLPVMALAVGGWDPAKKETETAKQQKAANPKVAQAIADIKNIENLLVVCAGALAKFGTCRPTFELSRPRRAQPGAGRLERRRVGRHFASLELQVRRVWQAAKATPAIRGSTSRGE